MKKLLFLICLFSVNVLGVAAQDMPPPPPLIYSAPLESEIKEFISQDDKFKISFPGKPSIESKDDGEIKAVSYKVRRKGSSSIVSHLTFKEDVEAKRDEFIKNYKESILNRKPRTKQTSYPKIYSEKELEIGSNKGFEIAYSFDSLVYEVVRLVFVKNRIYLISTDVTNWHILSDYHKDKIADFEKETERFFNSFKILE